MTARPIDILSSWHMVEFFQPYSIEVKPNHQQRVSKHELAEQQDNLLPWLSPLAKQQLTIENAAYYTLYIGIFDLSHVRRLCEEKFAESRPSSFCPEEIDERLDLEGDSCFVKLSLNQHGVPNWNSLSVSALPWALGCLQNDALDQLTSDNFQHKCEQFQDKVDLLTRHFGNDVNELATLNSKWIAQFIIELEEWAGMRLTQDYSFTLEWKEQKAPAKSVKSQSSTGQEAPQEQLKHQTNVPAERDSKASDDESEEDQATELPMPILNSFYFDDLEYAINAFTNNQAGKALTQYLSIEPYKSADLYAPEGLQDIQQCVSVARMPHGRWPSAPEHNMSLMQQYAINQAISELDQGGLLSVNGPPGTGKTTLLRDMIAHNVVERAKQLAVFSSVKNSLSRDGLPDAKLAGFEMLVASSNNGAVENISRELPLVKSIDQSFAELGYLTPVANQINARKKSGRRQSMKEEERCWGVISAVLGKKANRETFAQSLLFDTHFNKDSDAESGRSENQNFLNLWRWRALEKKASQPPCFKTAKASFQQALEQLDKVLSQLVRLDAVKQELDQGLLQQQVDTLSHSYQTELEAITFCHSEKLDKEAKLLQINHALELKKRLYKDHKASSPSLFTRLFQRSKYQAHFRRLSELMQDLSSAESGQMELRRELVNIERMIKDKEQRSWQNEKNIQRLRAQLADRVAEYEVLSQAFPKMSMPNTSDRINEPDLQRNAYWQNVEVNRLRSEVFVKAMALHEAWLFEALDISKFRTQVFKLSDLLAAPHKVPDPEALWRLFFMIVPVASTTFASVGRMLGGLSEEAIGWLFIDEAGQAIPQAAVGAIMRAKRVLVVGDPLQIEPVFTTSPDLVKALGEQRLGQHAEDWSPLYFSVQKIADRAHAYGCTLEVMNQAQWIGIPLWVHRRCVEPMFSLSNKIAYNDRMIHGLSNEKIQAQTAFEITEHWIESKGDCEFKQYKSQLAKDTCQLIYKILSQGGELKDLYVISPFKAVKNGLKKKLVKAHSVFCTEFSISKKDYISWLSNLGTVHTFQGKENEVVIFVLGCDPNNKGGAVWAGSKPNLLNVAVTRAKKNLYVVGDSSVWKEIKYFDELFACLDIDESKQTTFDESCDDVY